MKGNRKVRLGRVVGDNMTKTVVVAVETRRQHPRYKRYIRYIARFKAHDENNKCVKGDIVRIEETRPLSKEKCWRVVEIITKDEVPEVLPAEIDAAIFERGADQEKVGQEEE